MSLNIFKKSFQIYAQTLLFHCLLNPTPHGTWYFSVNSPLPSSSIYIVDYSQTCLQVRWSYLCNIFCNLRSYKKTYFCHCQRTWIQMVWNLVVLKQNLTTSIWILWPVKTWGFIPRRFSSLALADGRSRRKAIQKKFNSVPGKNEITTVWLMDISKTLTWDVLTKVLTSLYYSTSIWPYWILTVGRGLACLELLTLRNRHTYISESESLSVWMQKAISTWE